MDNPLPYQTCSITEEEREWRIEIIEKTMEWSRHQGYVLPPYMGVICKQFIDGELTQEELGFQIVKPFLH